MLQLGCLFSWIFSPSRIPSFLEQDVESYVEDFAEGKVIASGGSLLDLTDPSAYLILLHPSLKSLRQLTCEVRTACRTSPLGCWPFLFILCYMYTPQCSLRRISFEDQHTIFERFQFPASPRALLACFSEIGSQMLELARARQGALRK